MGFCSTARPRAVSTTSTPAAADLRLPLPPAAARHRGEPRVHEPLRDLAGGRSLQMARDARERRAERFCTGDAAPFEKFKAWAATVPHCLRNPLYHWTHLELQRYFDIDELLDETTAAARVGAGERAACSRASFRAHGILTKFRRQLLCTTDDPADDLAQSRGDPRHGARDARLPDVPAGHCARRPLCPNFNAWIERLAAAQRHRHRALRRPARRAPHATRTSTIPAAGFPIMGCRTATRTPCTRRARRPRFSTQRAPDSRSRRTTTRASRRS